jgi:hypothetical protein
MDPRLSPPGARVGPQVHDRRCDTGVAIRCLPVAAPPIKPAWVCLGQDWYGGNSRACALRRRRPGLSQFVGQRDNVLSAKRDGRASNTAVAESIVPGRRKRLGSLFETAPSGGRSGGHFKLRAAARQADGRGRVLRP